MPQDEPKQLAAQGEAHEPEPAPRTPGAPRRVFLSYANADRARVDAVRMLIELGGSDVFIDWRSIGPGERWEDALERELRVCDTLCVFWSRRATKSTWVEREYTTFQRLHPARPCVPLCADDTPLPSALAAHQAPNFLALANEALAIRRDLLERKVSRAESERVLRRHLDEQGIRLDPAQWKRMSAVFASGFSLAVLLARLPGALVGLFRTLAAKIAVAVAFVTAIGLLALPHCTSSSRATRDAAPAAIVTNHGHAAPSSVEQPPVLPEVIDAAMRVQPVAPKDAGTADAAPPADASIPCLVEYEPDAEARTIIDPHVSNTGSATCKFLDQALRASERDFAGVKVEPGVAQYGPRSEEAKFPLCDEHRNWPKIVWRVEGLHLLDRCEVRWFGLNGADSNGAPTSEFLTCTRELPLDASAWSAYTALADEVARCLSEDGWRSRSIDIPARDPAGRPILHGQRNGIGRTDFSRGPPGKPTSWSIQVELVPDDYTRPSQAEVELDVDLARMVDRT